MSLRSGLDEMFDWFWRLMDWVDVHILRHRFYKVCEWITDHHPDVIDLTHLVTEEEFDRLVEGYEKFGKEEMLKDAE